MDTIENAEERLTELLAAASRALDGPPSEETSTSLERLLEVLLRLDLSRAARPLPSAVAARLSLLLLDAFSRACRSEDPAAAAERWARVYEAAFGESGFLPEQAGRCREESCPDTRRMPISDLRLHHRETHLR